MDFVQLENIRSVVILDQKKNRRTYNLEFGGKGVGIIEWQAHIKARKNFLCHVISMELPPSVAYQDTYDRLLRNETVIFQLGISSDYVDALRDLKPYHFVINGIFRDKKTGAANMELQLADIPENPAIETCFKYLKYTINLLNNKAFLRIK